MATGFPVNVLTDEGFPVTLVNALKHIRYRGKKVGVFKVTDLDDIIELV